MYYTYINKTFIQYIYVYIYIYNISNIFIHTVYYIYIYIYIYIYKPRVNFEIVIPEIPINPT